MTTINSTGNTQPLNFPQNTSARNTSSGAGAAPQFKFKSTDISANTLADVGNELYSKGLIDAETHLMMTFPRLGSAVEQHGGLPPGCHVSGPHIQDPTQNIDMLQYVKSQLKYQEEVNEKYSLQKADTAHWIRFISTLEKLDGTELPPGIDITA